jgi:hypothetical protein
MTVKEIEKIMAQDEKIKNKASASLYETAISFAGIVSSRKYVIIEKGKPILTKKDD